jgi:Glycine zipper 2TM domain
MNKQTSANPEGKVAMLRHKSWSTLMIALPFALTAACSSGDADRSAEPQDSVARQLDLALKGDTTPASFVDTPVEKATVAAKPETRPVRKPAPPKPAPEPVKSEPPAKPAPRTISRTAAAGTTIQLSLNETLSTQTNQAGDGFTATVREPVLDPDGEVVIPAGALVHGRVTQVQKSGHVGETAILNLAFESVSFAGENFPLDASVVSANPERVNRSSTGEQVGKVAAGAAAGAILGRVLGKNTKSTIKGAVIGAAAGTAIAMGTADVDAVLKEGSLMVIKADSPVTITMTVE